MAFNSESILSGPSDFLSWFFICSGIIPRAVLVKLSLIHTTLEFIDSGFNFEVSVSTGAYSVHKLSDIFAKFVEALFGLLLKSIKSVPGVFCGQSKLSASTCKHILSGSLMYGVGSCHF